MSLRMLRYAAVGLVGTIAQYVVFIALKESGTGIVPASVIGCCVGAIVNYYLNFKFTFALRSSHGHAAPRFFLVALFGLVLQSTIVYLLSETHVLHYVVIQAIATVVCFVILFALNNIWSFRTAQKATDRGSKGSYRKNRVSMPSSGDGVDGRLEVRR